MASHFSKPYLDSSFWFAHIKQEAIPAAGGLLRYEITTRILRDAEDRKYDLYTSAAAIAEVRRIREKNATLDERELEQIQTFFEHDYIHVIDVTREIGERAAHLGAKFGISPIDAIHLASAIWWQCDVLLVWDKTFMNRVTTNPIDGVRIIEPYWEGQETF